MTKKRELLLGFAAIIFGMFLTFSLLSSLTKKDSGYWTYFYMFTQQSNILCAIWMILFGIGCYLKEGSKLKKFTQNKLLIIALTVYISITFFIVALVLSPIYNGSFDPFSSTPEFMHHNATPIVMWFFFFLIPGVGRVNIKTSPLILIYPLCYVIMNLIVGANTTFPSGEKAYAYGFINPNSYPNIFIYVLVLVGLIIIFGGFSIGLTAFKNYINKHYHEIQE